MTIYAQGGYHPHQTEEKHNAPIKTVAIILAVIAILVLMIGIHNEHSAPISGRIIEKGVQQGLSPYGDRRDSYWIKLQNGNHGAIWYVDQATYLQHQIGDMVGGRIE